MISPFAPPEFKPVKSNTIVVSIMLPVVTTECFTIAFATAEIPVPTAVSYTHLTLPTNREV